MNVLHYSFSLSACAKCHLLVCKHTSLADLDFNPEQQITPTNSIETNLKNVTVTDGMNLYLFPSTMIDNRYSWTTFGTELNESTSTIRHSSSSNDNTICENIPFANENLRQSIVLVTPTNFSQDSPPTKTLSFHSIQQSTHRSKKSSVFIIFLLIFTFLLTNTIDLVLIYLYAYTNSVYLISYLSTIIICDMIIWIDDLIRSKKSIPSVLLLIPFYRRFYLLYKLLECIVSVFEQNRNQQIFSSVYKTKKQKLFQQLTVFYLVHTSIFSFVNLYFWSNRFRLSTKLTLNMDHFLPQWVDKLDSTLNTHSILPYVFNIESNPIPLASTFVLMSISYYLMINYCLLSTYLFVKRNLFVIVLSKVNLIIPRLYAFVFLFHLNAHWLSITFLLIHSILILTLTFNRKNFKDKKLFLRLIFSFVTHQSIDDVSINAIISIENISIFLHQLYLEVFSVFHYQTTLRIIIFISILISLQIIGFVCHVLSKHFLGRKKTIEKL